MLDKILTAFAGIAFFAIISLVFTAAYATVFMKKHDTAEDVMRSCADTGMYLHKGYAISCRVLIDGAHEQQGMKI